MTNPPERIWFTPWDDGEETGTAGPARHTKGKPPNGDATEYIRNDPAAMRDAGYVPAVTLQTETVSVREYITLLNKYIGLKGQLDDVLKGEGE